MKGNFCGAPFWAEFRKSSQAGGLGFDLTEIAPVRIDIAGADVAAVSFSAFRWKGSRRTVAELFSFWEVRGRLLVRGVVMDPVSGLTCGDVCGFRRCQAQYYDYARKRLVSGTQTFRVREHGFPKRKIAC